MSLSLFLLALCLSASEGRAVQWHEGRTAPQGGHTPSPAKLFTPSPQTLATPEGYEGQIASLSIEIGQGGIYKPQRLAVLRAGAGEVLRIAFDRLGDTPEELGYRIVGCQSDGSPSRLRPMELLGRWEPQLIEQYRPSVGTALPYTHYAIELSAEGLGLRRAGRYAIEIYRWEDDEAVLLSLPLWYYTPKIGVEGHVVRPLPTPVSDKQQALELRLSLPADFTPRAEGIVVQALQNYSFVGEVLQPRAFASKSSTLWTLTGSYALHFWGGDEFVPLEHVQRRAVGAGIERSYLRDGVEYAELYPDRDGRGEVYLYREDYDGVQSLRSRETSDVAHEGQYHMVVFRLKASEVEGCDVVLEGEAFDCLPIDKRTLHYDRAEGEYRLSLPLKNGVQEYRYQLRPRGAGATRPEPIVGSHYETTNRYTVFVYHKTYDRDWEELLGYATL